LLSVEDLIFEGNQILNLDTSDLTYEIKVESYSQKLEQILSLPQNELDNKSLSELFLVHSKILEKTVLLCGGVLEATKKLKERSKKISAYLNASS
jgi:hypothetical protein